MGDIPPEAGSKSPVSQRGTEIALTAASVSREEHPLVAPAEEPLEP